MASGADVLSMLYPEGGWIIVGDDFDGITWVGDNPGCTKKVFEDGWKVIDAYLAKKESDKAAQKQAILERLGITQEEANILLG
jgi:hypothetical protein